MIFVGVAIGFFVGKFILGGIYYAIFVPETVNPESPRGKSIELIWSIIGALIGALIAS